MRAATRGGRVGRRGAPFILFLTLGACSNDLDALLRKEPDDAGMRERADSGAGHDTGAAQLTPYQAALNIYGDDQACTECVEGECEAQARTCADDDACAQDVRCRVECGDDPICQLACADQLPISTRPSDALENCVVESCLEACRVGRNYDCVGEYVRPVPSLETPVVFSIQVSSGFALLPLREAGIRARVCEWPDTDCREEFGAAASDATGLIALELPLPTRAAGRVNAFAGYVEIGDSELDPERFIPTLFATTAIGVPGAPWFSNAHPWPMPMVKTEDVAAMAAIWEHGQLPDRGVVFGTLWDCRNSERARATDAMIELIPADSAAETLYNLSRGLEATTVTGAFQISNVQPGIATVRAHHAGRIVASADVPVRSGALTWVFFFPTSS